MQDFKPCPSNLYDVWVVKNGVWTELDVYLMGDDSMTKVMPNMGYKDEATAIRATKRKLGLRQEQKNLLIHYDDSPVTRWA